MLITIISPKLNVYDQVINEKSGSRDQIVWGTRIGNSCQAETNIYQTYITYDNYIDLISNNVHVINRIYQKYSVIFDDNNTDCFKRIAFSCYVVFVCVLIVIILYACNPV